MLWNPSTRESILLPQTRISKAEFLSFGILGYDSTIGDYKILKIDIRSPNEGSKVPGEILTLKSGSWRNIDKFPHGLITWASGIGSSLALVNNAFHWICVSGEYYGVSRTFCLVSFSISNEVYSEIPLPEQLSCIKGNIDIGISEVKEMLCAYCTYVPQQQRTFKLWILKNYGVYESWNSVLSIVDHDLVRAIPKYWFADGDVLFWSSYLAAKPRCSFRTTSRGAIGLCDDNIRNGFVFMESLISPKSLI
ncbi:F-box protein like [Capsicum annuum]|nr:F-box protein At4g22390-like [Capsicum annuum]